MQKRQKDNLFDKLTKTELIVYFCLSVVMLLLSLIIGDKYVGYVLIYLVFLWLTIYFLSKRNGEILDRISNFTLLILAISPVLVYLIVLVIDIVVLRFPTLFYVEGSKNAWIGFAGSIIGGAMTMFALVFTIQHNEKQHKKEFNLRIMPYIEAVKNENFSSKLMDCPIRIINRSEYPLSKLSITSSVGYLNEETVEVKAKLNNRVDFLPKNGECLVEIKDYSFNLKNLKESDEFEISIGCSFYDYMNETEYFHEFDFCIELVVTEDQGISIPSLGIDNVHNTFTPDYERFKKDFANWFES